MHSADKDWFDWAETHLEDWKKYDAQWGEALSSDAKEVLKFARQAAVILRHDAVGAEHLLAGLLKRDQGLAADTLNSAGLSLSVLRAEIEAERGLGIQEKQDLSWTPRASGIIMRSAVSVCAMNRARIEPEDILVEILKEETGLPAQIFRKRAIDAAGMRREIAAKTC